MLRTAIDFHLTAGVGQMKYRQTPTQIAIKWHTPADIRTCGKPAHSAERFSRLLGLIVQPAIIDEIDPDAAAKRIEKLIARQPLPRRSRGAGTRTEGQVFIVLAGAIFD